MTTAETAQSPALNPALLAATEDQPRARAALSAALASRPLHAYLFQGPRGTGKRGVARAFAAELLALEAPDPDSARRRAMADPSPHPDLAWLRPPGAQHLVDEVREQVIHGAAMRPLEGGHRVFVIEAADAMADESQNALLKTLEEPPAFVHLLLLSSEPELIAETVLSRCQVVPFEPLAPEAVERRLAGSGAPPLELRAAARLCRGDAELAALLVSEHGRQIRQNAERFARAARRGERGSPWAQLLDEAESLGREQAAIAEAALVDRAESAGKREQSRLKREAGDAAKRVARRERTAVLDLALALAGAWYRDLAAVAAGGGELVLNADRAAELETDARGLSPEQARRACELTLDTRRRLTLNVSETLALEALFFRLQSLVGN
jgi:DNA polymerase-3 subunit delta'